MTFKVDSLPHRQPVKLPQHRRDVLSSTSSSDHISVVCPIIFLKHLQFCTKIENCPVNCQNIDDVFVLFGAAGVHSVSSRFLMECSMR